MAEGGSFFSQQVGEPQRRAFLELDRRLGEVQATIDALSPAHGDLTGLGDDDHPQYLTEARGDARYYTQAVADARYYTQSQVDSSLTGKSDTSHTHSYAATSHTHSYLPLSGGTLTGGLTLGGDLNYANNAIVASDAGSTNIDHIWHDETNNAWNFVSDSTYKAAGNSALNAGTLNVTTANATTVNLSTSVHLTNVDPDGSMRVQGDNGYIDIGPKNATYCHIYTDRGSFYFNRDNLYANGNLIYHAGNIPSYASSSHSHSYISSDSTNTSNLYIRNTSPTVYLRDTNNRSSMIHCNSNWFYVLRGSGNDSTTWTQTGGQWPLTVYLETNDVYVGGQLVVPTMAGTTSYNTVRWNSSNGHLMRYTSLAEFKQDIVGINDVLGALNERSLLHDLRPVLFHETEELGSSRGEYIAGFIAEEVHEVAPELTFYDQEGKLTSYAPDALIPHLVAEVQRLTGLVESLYAETHPDWVAPQPRPSDRGLPEKELFDSSAAHTVANPFVIPEPEVPEEPLEEEE